MNEKVSDGAAWRNRGWLFGLFVVVATVVAYLPVWHAGFVWDDDVLLTANPLIKSPDGWYHFWFTTKTPDYFPVMSSVLWLEWRLWGMNAAGYHVVNVLLHAVNAILLWRLLARLMPQFETVAKLAAAIFALHPVNVESVAWIAELKNTLSFFFFVLSLLWYLKFDDHRRWRWYGLSLGAFLFALLSKIEVAPLPFVLLGIAWWRRGRVEWKEIWRTAPFFGMAFLLGLVSIWFQNHVAIGHDVVRTDNFWSRLAGTGWAVWFYLYKTLLPLNLLAVYPRWQIDPTAALSYVPALLLIVVFVVAWFNRGQWGKPLLFGLGYAVLMFLPVLGFLNIYFFRFSLVANHWQYFSIIAPITLAAWGIVKGADFLARRKVFLPLQIYGALLLVLGFLTWQQAAIYQNSETLWSATLAKSPGCFVGQNDLGFALLERGQVGAALPHFQKAVQLQPDDEASWKNLGSALLQEGRVDDAIARFQKALALRPDDPGAHSNLGLALFRKGRTDDAIAEYQRALKIQPDDASARHNLGLALFRQGRMDEAIDQYQKALAVQPGSAELYSDLANALARQGHEAEAIQDWQKALEIQPKYMPAQNNLAWALATSPDAAFRNGVKAIELAQRANQLSGGKNPLVLRTLAAAYAEAGQFSNAIVAAGQAQVQAAVQHDLPLANAIEAQSKFYEAGQPYHTGGD